MKKGIFHLDEAMRHLREIEDSDAVMQVLTMTRTLRDKYFYVQSGMLARVPGSER